MPAVFSNPIQTVYKRLRQAGANPKFVQKTILPAWWDDNDAHNPAALAQALTLISRNLGVSIDALQDPSLPIECRSFGPTKYKRRDGLTAVDLRWAQCIASRAAELAVSAIPAPLTAIPTAATHVRDVILEDANCVNLSTLLDFCWDSGIPVLHVSKFPSGSKKMDGLAARFLGRPAIVLSRNETHPAWLVFILAHEMGHIACGHLDGDGILVDSKVQMIEGDVEEAQANAYGAELLTGHPGLRLTADRWLNAEQLAQNAISLGAQMGIDPGVVALNYGWSEGLYTSARAALNLIDSETNAVALVREKMLAHLDWDQLPPESCDYLLRVTGADQIG